MTSKRDTPIGDIHKAEIAKLRRKVSELEKMLLPNQADVYKAAMYCYRTFLENDGFNISYLSEKRLIRACKRARGGK